MFCKACGAGLPDGVRFCGKCGATVTVEGPVGLDTTAVAAASTVVESAAVAAAPEAPAAEVTLGIPPIAPPARRAGKEQALESTGRHL